MRLEIHSYHGKNFAKLFSDDVILKTHLEILDMIENAGLLGAKLLIIKKEHLSMDFYDLNSNIAESLLQNISNSELKMIVVGDLNNNPDRRFPDFIHECHTKGQLFFVESMHDAKQKMK